MARGTPVIAINSGGPTESVKHRDTGFLLEKNPEAWVECMELLKNNSKLREKMGIAAKHHANLEFSLPSLSKNLESSLSLLV